MATIEDHQAWRKRKKNIAKILLSERISGRSIFDQKSMPECSPYLEHNAQDRGDLKRDKKHNDLRYQESIVNHCGKSVVWLEGQDTGDNYLKKIECRKQWCPVCGGKGGKIHKHRLHAELKRVDVNNYNLQQSVLTVPVYLRHFFIDRENLEYLEQSAKKLTEKFFGVPVFDSKGHIKKYRLEVGVIVTTHLFGEVAGVFHPHINIQVLAKKNEKLKLDKSILKAINKFWLKKLQKFDEKLEVVDTEYSFKTSPHRVMHALKYMCRPWSVADYEAIQDDRLKEFLVIDLSGFRYLRFWGALADKRYKDEMILPDLKDDVESVVCEKLKMLFVAPFDEVAWSGKIDLIADGLYKVRKRNSIDEEKNYKECFDFFSSQADYGGTQ